MWTTSKRPEPPEVARGLIQLVCFLHFRNSIRMGEYWKRNHSTCCDPKLLCIQVPSSAQDSPLMKDLKRGQKGYFYSIMRIYDSKAPREMLYRRYAINLQCQNVLGLITKQQVECYASYLKDSQSYRRSRLGTAPPVKAVFRKAQLGLFNQI
ncbi:protein FAM216B [Sceloporus undulatus]|uniref:protein FAM216B n=1 Tax=Sceloporus undulatus TaxID=8520 RepID=UPI001C4DC03B|nr:protein FAM216B [Sceloporus undulatus]